MKKSTLNFAINALMFLCMSAVIGIGFLIKYTLIPGQERWIVYGKNVELSLLGLDRHQWGSIHLIVAFILLGLLALHLYLHWNTIFHVYKRISKQKTSSKLIAISFLTICSLFIVIPFITNPTVSETEHNDNRHAMNDNVYTNKISNTITLNKEETSLNNISHNDLTFEIRGYMTLSEISKKYKVPTQYIKASLNIPDSFSDNQKLSLLRKEYNITMDAIEKAVKDYLE